MSLTVKDYLEDLAEKATIDFRRHRNGGGGAISEVIYLLQGLMGLMGSGRTTREILAHLRKLQPLDTAADDAEIDQRIAELPERSK